MSRDYDAIYAMQANGNKMLEIIVFISYDHD